MNDNRERTAPRSSLGLFFSRLWQRLSRRANPAPNDIHFQITIPVVNLPAAVCEARRFALVKDTLNLEHVGDQTNLQNIVDQSHRNHGLARAPELLRAANIDPRIFQTIQQNWQQQGPFFRPRQQAQPARTHQPAQEAAHQWWLLLALPDPDNYRNPAKLAGNPNLDIPEEFVCAITHEIMTDPVYDPKFPQQRYDRHVIERWLSEHSTNPCTRTPLYVEDLADDPSLKTRIDEFVANELQKSGALTLA